MECKKSKNIILNNRFLDASRKLCTPEQGEDVVITGIAGHFPNCDNVDSLKNSLFNKVDLISEDDRHWRPTQSIMPQRIGKLNDILSFDAGFFGISRRHANNIDPQLRLALERTFEAIVDAGYNPSELKNTKTGVFFGVTLCESQVPFLYKTQTENGDGLLGNMHSMLAHYLSYFFELQGPSHSADAACCSSMSTLEQAYRSLRDGTCDMAIVSSAALCLHPMITQSFARLGVLSTDGACKAFSDNSDGYVRAETVCTFLLQRSKHARRSYAQIVHCKISHDGYTEQGITFPSSESQTILMKEVYAECNVDVSNVSLIEAHGSGTHVGDQQELSSIADVFCSGRNSPLYIGSVKSNMGHSEPASALTSVLKVIFAMESGFIPPNLNYTKPRESVQALVDGQLKVVTEKTPWPNNNGLAGANSFGMGGSNGHVLLRWNEKRKINCGIPEDDVPRLICASGRTREAVNSIWDSLRNNILDAEFVKLFHAVFGKEFLGHHFRGYQILSKKGEVSRSVKEVPIGKGKLLWVISNFDEKWPAVGKSLLAFPIFEEILEKIQNVLGNDINLLEFIKNFDGKSEMCQIISTMALQICLVEILKALEIIPDFIVGLGTGELIAAYLEDYLSLTEVVCAHLLVGSSLCEKGESEKELLSNLKKLSSKQRAPFKKWLPLRNRNRIHQFEQGSAEYFHENIASPIEFYEAKEFIPNDVDILVIGARAKNAEDFSLVREDSDDCVLNFLTTLGGIYENGRDLHLDKLYPNITWPVSRGTPSMSPLIKWNHNQKWFVALYDDEAKLKGGQRFVSINIKEEEWSFITGHVVDGQNIFPVVGYLSIVWETLAMMSSKQQAQMKTVFENVKVFRTLSLTDTSTLELTVTVLRENGSFEITEGDVIIVTGTVYEPDETEQELENIHKSTIKNSSSAVLTQGDIYKEFRIRGYNYKGAFKALKECDVEEGEGLIMWEENWTTFMDVMLQYVLLQMDTKNLYMLTGIEQVIIDAPKHISALEKSNEEETIKIKINHELDIVRSGGIKFRGLKLTPVQKRNTPAPILEMYNFIPNRTSLSLEESILIVMQIVVENSTTNKIRSVELASDKELLSVYIRQALDNMPSVIPEPVVLSKTPLDLNGVTIQAKELSEMTNSLMVVVSNLFQQDGLMEAVLNVVKDTNGYVLTREKLNFDPSFVTHKGLNVLCVHHVNEESLILLQKSTECKPAVFLEVSDDLLWLPIAQKAVISNRRLVLYSQNNPTSGIMGLVKCLRREPSGRNTTCFFILDEAPKFDPNHPFYEKQLRRNLAFNVWKSGVWGTHRYLPLKENWQTQLEHCYADGSSNIEYLEGRLPEIVCEAEDKIILVCYAAVNFRDVLLRTGKITVDAISTNRVEREVELGFEFSGRDETGKRVMGLSTNGALATQAIANSLLTWEIPDEWSLEDAATVPAVYSLVIHALIMEKRANIKRGQSILIQGGPGGLGEAAINVALHFNCAIFVIVETQEERDYLRNGYPQIKTENISDSYDTSFEYLVFLQTNECGVDIILNSQAKDTFLSPTRCLAENGQFLKIGNADGALEFDLFGKGVAFHGVTLEMILRAKLELKTQLSYYVAHFIQEQVIKPLPRIVFQKCEITRAFDNIAGEKSMGKTLVKMRQEEFKNEFFQGLPRYFCDLEGTYIIVGGLGGFGLQLADWLVSRGAKKMILTTRSGVKNNYQLKKIKLWQSYGVEVVIRKDDVVTEEGCFELINFANSLGPVEAVFNLAMVLKDSLFENQTIESFQMSLGPKAAATRHLDFVTRKMCPQLKHFVAFSSAVTDVGNEGQTNYAMANSIMDQICMQRKANGFPALAIQWGCIDDVGLLAEQYPDLKYVIHGVMQQKILSCLEVLNDFLTQDEPVVRSIVLDEKFDVTKNVDNIVDAVLNILALPDINKINIYSTFGELGMDSARSLEIQQTLEKDHEVLLSTQDLGSMTFAKNLLNSTEPLNDDNEDNLLGSVRNLRNFNGKGGGCWVTSKENDFAVENLETATIVL